MDVLNRLIIDSIGLVLGFFCLFITALTIIIPALVSKKSKDVSVQLKTKDATIENLQVQLSHANAKLAEVEGYKKRADDEQENNQAVIQGLHKRISELETNQFFEVNEKGGITIKSGRGLRIPSGDKPQ